MLEKLLNLPPMTAEEQRDYVCAVSAKLQEYSLMPRKQGEPLNEGTKDWLEGIEHADPLDPINYACWVMQGWNFHYQKQTVGRIRRSLLNHLA